MDIGVIIEMAIIYAPLAVAAVGLGLLYDRMNHQRNGEEESERSTADKIVSWVGRIVFAVSALLSAGLSWLIGNFTLTHQAPPNQGILTLNAGLFILSGFFAVRKKYKLAFTIFVLAVIILYLFEGGMII